MGASLLDDTPFSFAPRHYKDADGNEQTCKPLAPIVDAWSAVMAKELGAAPPTPEAALEQACLMYAVSVGIPAVFGWVKVATANAGARRAEAEARKAEAQARGDLRVVGRASTADGSAKVQGE
jgi:hypothetical protein